MSQDRSGHVCFKRDVESAILKGCSEFSVSGKYTLKDLICFIRIELDKVPLADLMLKASSISELKERIDQL
jgi:hypothetical protein